MTAIAPLMMASMSAQLKLSFFAATAKERSNLLEVYCRQLSMGLMIVEASHCLEQCLMGPASGKGSPLALMELATLHRPLPDFADKSQGQRAV